MIDRIQAILMLEKFITKRSIEIFADIVVYPVVAIVVFGYLSLYLLGNAQSAIAHSILLGIVLWQVAFIVQYSVATGILWNIWWRNLSNLFVTPLSIKEYVVALAISATIKAGLIFLFGAVIAELVFGFSVFAVGGINIFMFLLNLIIFGFCFGILIMSLIFRFGTRIQALAWGLLPILQPITATFYPVSVLPKPIQYISYMLPPTYIFEAMRYSLNTSGVHVRYLAIGTGANLIFAVLVSFLFQTLFRKAKETGQFVRNEG